MTFLDDVADDLSNVYMDVSLGFAVNATTSGAATIAGVFQKDYFESDPGGNVSISSSTPMFRAISTAASGVDEGDSLTIGGTAYTVVEVQPDESGITDFRLMET